MPDASMIGYKFSPSFDFIEEKSTIGTKRKQSEILCAYSLNNNNNKL